MKNWPIGPVAFAALVNVSVKSPVMSRYLVARGNHWCVGKEILVVESTE